jgi:hypothetical protein
MWMGRRYTAICGNCRIRIRIQGRTVVPFWVEMGIPEEQIEMKLGADYGVPKWLRRWCRELECAFAGVICHDRWIERSPSN